MNIFRVVPKSLRIINRSSSSSNKGFLFVSIIIHRGHFSFFLLTCVIKWVSSSPPPPPPPPPPTNIYINKYKEREERSDKSTREWSQILEGGAPAGILWARRRRQVKELGDLDLILFMAMYIFIFTYDLIWSPMRCRRRRRRRRKKKKKESDRKCVHLFL